MGESKFTGRLIGLIGIGLLQILLVLITIGFALPWAVVIKQRWYAKHTYIDGKQLVFKGTGGQLFGKYVVWLLLTFVTIGIYGFWLVIKVKKWTTKHIHFA